MRAILPLALAAAAASCATTGQTALMAQDARAAAGVAYDAARRVVGPPGFTNVENPASLAGNNLQSLQNLQPPQPVAYEPAGPSSLWRAGARSFFNDQRASRVGDILTVNIEIADKAELTNHSARQRTASSTAGVNHFLGMENIPGHVLPGGFDPAHMIDGSADSSQSGQGTINREEKIRLTVAAVIVEILPNGNLVIAGRQEARINAELRELTVSGIIRPEDIGADNTIRNDQIAEARISYGGRGQLSAVQRPNWGQRIADAITPW